MADFFATLGSVIESCVTFLTNLIEGMIQLFLMIPKAVQVLTYSISNLPPVLTVFATAFIGVSIVYLIIGR